MNRRECAIAATKEAMSLRARLGHAPHAGVCPFDIAERLGVEVRLMAAPSLEGMYAAERQTIIVNSLRPSGRRNFTCGHELGHHVYGHGTRLDGEAELAADSVEEFVANSFARALLMPKLAVTAAFVRRAWPTTNPTAERVFVVARELGVGFTALVDHMAHSLGLITHHHADGLRRTSLPRLRAALAGASVEHDAIPVDAQWGPRPIDVEVGDVVLVPDGALFSGECASKVDRVLRAVGAGTGGLLVPGRNEPISIRVSRRAYAGRAVFRHLEESDDD